MQTNEDQNPATDTPTDGTATATRIIDIGYELDVTLDAPPSLTRAEDSSGVGVTLDLGIQVAATDIDGSENSTSVEIQFTVLPSGAMFSTGQFDPATGTWTGSMAAANALNLTLPEDYSGTIQSQITAISPEGQVSTDQVIEITPTGDIALDVEELRTQETDFRTIVTPSTVWQVSVDDNDGNAPFEMIETVSINLADLPPNVLVLNVPASTYSYDPATGGGLNFTGTQAQYQALQLSFPTDYSTESPTADGLVLTGTLSATSTEDSSGVSAPVVLRITPEGDVEIDDTLPDTVPDETNSSTLITPSDLLQSAVTDIDGSEALETLTLVIEGLPAGADETSLAITVPTGANLSFVTDPVTGARTLTLVLDAASVGDVAAAYSAFNFTLPADFSTANRSDLTDGSATLPLTFTLDVQTDEDQDPATDTPTDGTATASRIVDIGFEEDISLVAPLRITAQEDDGNTGDPDLGVDVNLEIQIDITDQDGSETADPSDPRFAAQVNIQMFGLPTGTGVNGGTLTGTTWTGTVAQANDLILSLPPNYNGEILNLITVTTPEGVENTVQGVIVSPTPDIIIEGAVTVDETDNVVEVMLSDFIDIIVDPSETILNLTFDLDGLPTGTEVVDGGGNPIGTFTDNGDGTSDFLYIYNGVGSIASDAIVRLPKDYSTTSPTQNLFAGISVTTNEGTVSRDVPVTVREEGDLAIGDGSFDLEEIDAPVTFRPADQITPTATDMDGSESVSRVAVLFNALPSGTRYSIDGGSTFQDALPTLQFVGTLAEYNNLIIELPTDYSTENPATTLTGSVFAITDEGGLGRGDLTVTVDAEGDLALSGPGRLDLIENDAPGNFDEDNTANAPIDARIAGAISASSPDADGSESIATVDVSVSGLPDGTQYSTDGGTTFTLVPAGPTFVLNGLTDGEYNALILRLPNDFSTTTDITGSATFTTDEALLAGETDVDGTDGVETRDFVITVASEQDVLIAAQNITVIEDLGTFIPFNLNTAVTDIDGSESITAITVDFTGLPAGNTVLTDGVIVNGPADSWTGTVAELQALGVVSFPQHFSGIVGVTVTVQTDEGTAAGTYESFDLNVTPVAEPTLVLSVDDSPGSVDRIADENYLVDEDSSFLMIFDAQTPDRDGSEQLTTIVVENLPAGWVPNTNGNVDLALFEQGAAQVSSATISGTTLTITLNGSVQEFMGALRVTPLADDDRDAATIVGNDLVATVTSVDAAAGLPSDTQTAQDDLDIDVDAIVDPIDFTVTNSRTNENIGGAKRLNIELSNIALQDNDGSEVLQSLSLSIAVATESDSFDPSNTNDLLLEVRNKGLASKVQIVQAGSTLTSVDYTITPLPTTSALDFAAALDDLRIEVPRHFSGVLTLDGTLAWNETTTGDVEIDTSDNFATSNFQIIQTVRPRAEAELTASVFVRASDEVADDSPQIVSATIKDGSVSGDKILTLLESTADGSGPGQVDLYVGLDVSTPDTDGSEQIESIVISNIPTDWVTDHLSGTTLQQSAFFQPDGGLPLTQATYDLIDSATFDQATGDLTISFVPDVTSFEASLQLRPSLYEDYDVDRQTGDPFSSVGDFFGDDLNIEVSVSDDNTDEVRNAQADATFDVDVDPVNNIAVILTLPQGNEQVIDDAGGVWQIPFEPIIQDNDGSESVTAVVMREVPNGVTVYVEDPSDPGGAKIPALLTDVNVPPGFNSWSLENGSWLTAELRGIPTHYAGDYPLKIDVVTTESDGGNTRITTLDKVLHVDPVVDGGDPSESFSGEEDTALAAPLDGNIIDNLNNSPGSPEAILGVILVSNIVPDSFGRLPTFFVGSPQADPVVPGNYYNALPIGNNGELQLSPAQAAALWVLPGQDSNETIRFDVTLVYYETIDATQTQTATGTVTIDVVGIADDPIIEVQNPDPTDDPNSGITDDQIDDAYRPTEIVDGIANADRVYGYAGRDSSPFALDARIRDIFLQAGPISPDTLFRPADSIEGRMTEITFAGGQFDGSETLYYLITGVDPSVSFLGATPVDATGESYIVTADQLAALEFVPTNVSEVTYYDMTLHAIVVEDDQPLDGLIGTPEEVLALIDNLPGGSVIPMDFTVLVVPATGNGPAPCEPEQDLPLPILELVGSGDEDTVIELKIKITPQPPFYDSIDDLVNLPNGVTGDFGIGIELPPGSSLATDPPGGALFDPVTGYWVIDLSVLGVDPNDPTQTEGSLLFTPPPHESSPANPFDPAETFGPDDPYDELDTLNYSMILDNFTCGTTTSGDSTFNLTINPVVDQPVIRLTGGRAFDEDTIFDLGLSITSPDGGERPGDTVEIDLDTRSGAELLDENGNPLTGTDIGGGFTRYVVDYDDIETLGVRAAEHYSGVLDIRITATSEDINGTTASSTLFQSLEVIPVADDPFFNFNDTLIDPDTGQPFVDESGPVPIITAIEDIPLNLGQFIEANTPDQDGSEAIAIVLAGVPDYLNVTGPSNNGFIDNGDGSYTISEAAFSLVSIQLKDDHARTPDSLDPILPSEIPLTLTVNTLELANSDQATGTQDFILRVRPDADTPVLTASIDPTTGVEDSGDLFTLTLSGETPDPHETMSFEIAVPAGGKIFVDGVEQPVVGGVVTLSATPSPTVNPSINLGFAPARVVTFLAPPDFGGMTSLDVTAITTDADGIFTDSERTPTQSLDLDIAVASDLVFNVLDPDVELDETDAIVTHDPSGDFDVQVTDTDGSEMVDNVTYTITGVPDGMAYQVGSAPVVPVTGNLAFSGSLVDFQQLTLIFPQDYATNGTPLNGMINVTTNEGGNENGIFTIDVDGELDLSVLVDVQPDAAPQTGTPIVVDFGITATVTDVQPIPSETLDEVVVQFTDPLPPGTTASAGTINGDRLTLTRGSTSPADFAALVAALSITLPGTYAGALEGTITVFTNHGSGTPDAFQVAINDQPDVSGPVDISSTDPSFTISFNELLANSTDPDQPLTVENVASSDPLVGLNVIGSTVFVTVPNAYVGTPTLTYDVVDSSTVPARSTATANLDIDTLQMEPNGTHSGPDGVTRDLMDNVTGAIGGTDIARGGSGDDAVILNLTTPYTEIEGFELQGGTDFVDLSNSTRDFTIDLGNGDDWGVGGNGNDVLIGGAGADTLEGGGGTDVFTITDLGSADVILDFEEPVGFISPIGIDQIDLTSVVTLTLGEDLADHVGYDNSNGELAVDGSLAATVNADGGGFADEIEVIFTNAIGAQETAII
ncbi:cadherin-like domain-containing protein [Falsiruegeria litorea]|uniref:cadherin-like domain-containing protein n=1 Tax=Falsiruegeria litorea TaxID=1280831 RepID=UPI001BFDA06E|nr:cadherin-like domain-containing protein [Falsiruegeria litorea]MBT8168344.1 cadherin-like domain-containing protein [Falsiruegeria litorea]